MTINVECEQTGTRLMKEKWRFRVIAEIGTDKVQAILSTCRPLLTT